MATKITFSEGLSHADGATLEAPYDLVNARLAKAQGAEALMVPRQPSSDTPPTPTSEQQPVRHAQAWYSVEGETSEGAIQFVSDPSTPGLRTYRAEAQRARTRIPQIQKVDVGQGGISVAENLGTADFPAPRYIYYLLVPINDNGEAGPFAFAGKKIKGHADKGRLPRLDIRTNGYVRWIGVYRTAAIHEAGRDSVSPGAQAFYEADRLAVGGGGLDTDAILNYAADLPVWDDAGTTTSTYFSQTGIDYLYLGTSQSIPQSSRVRADNSNVNPIGWRMEFYDLPPGSSLKTGNNQTYEVYDAGTDAQGDYRYFIKEVGATDGSLSFGGRDLLHPVARPGRQPPRVGRGAEIEYFPPSGAGTTTARAIFEDENQWYLDIPDDKRDGNPPAKTPTGDVFDRPFNTYAPQDISAEVQGSHPVIGQTDDLSSPGNATVLRPEADTLHFSGGTLYAGAPTFPAKKPHPMYIEQDNSDGFDVRLQHEYVLPEGRTLGPPTTLSNVTKLSVGWQGAESALYLFVNGGQPQYKIVGANIARVNTINLDAAPDWFQTEVSVGDDLPIRHGGKEILHEVTAVNTGYGGSSDVQFEVKPSKDIVKYDQVVARDSTHLTVDTSSISSDYEIKIRDTNGRFSDFEHAEVTVNPLGDPNLTTETYLVASASHSTDVTTLTVGSKVKDHQEGANCKLVRTTSIDSTSSSGTTKLVAKDPNNRLSSLSGGDTINVDEGPNSGSHTLSAAPSTNTPEENQTTLPVNSLSEESTTGSVSNPNESGPTWRLYRRLTVGPYGQYMRSGSTFAFSADSFTLDETEGRSDNLISYNDRIREADAVFMSNIERALELTFDQFRVPRGEVVRSVFPAQPSQEEGLQAYRFYVGTDEGIYVADPDPTKRAASVYSVTTSFGLGTSEQDRPAYALVPNGVVVKATDGGLYVLSGRQIRQLFPFGASDSRRKLPSGSAPWENVQALLYDESESDLLIATDTGVWLLEWGRKALVGHYDLDVSELVYDDERGVALAYDTDAGFWKGLDQSPWIVLDADTSNDTIDVKGDVTKGFSQNDTIVLPDSGTYQIDETVSSADFIDTDSDGVKDATRLAVDGDITSVSDAKGDLLRFMSAEVQTQPITATGREVSFESVQVGYDTPDYDIGDSSTWATLEQTRRRSDDKVSAPHPSNKDWYPPLRGEGLQVRVKGFTTLEDIRINDIEPAD